MPVGPLSGETVIGLLASQFNAAVISCLPSYSPTPCTLFGSSMFIRRQLSRSDSQCEARHSTAHFESQEVCNTSVVSIHSLRPRKSELLDLLHGWKDKLLPKHFVHQLVQIGFHLLKEYQACV